ncbi:uncharacterized protein RCC_06886 [Ramularia collo-cygni]|uniref:Uncharacterized protein n=1 Tax=Ramularia collo-cygni TaxID=112498 RepID=A0A2D3V2U1_9PEZI|nr:uncharacterized protein RCC_06886 [Ramularia collo-cygni]CZT21025.1 uncharacterized protein RCC_06886 [Ramularia collo-cygni]
MKLPWTFFLASSLLFRQAASQDPLGGLSGSHTDIPRWCGKPYELGSPAFDPGGRLQPPAMTKEPLLDIRITPRYNIYDSNEVSGQFVVDVSTSYVRGEVMVESWKDDLARSQPTSWSFEIVTEDASLPLASGNLFLNTTAKLLRFSLNRLEPRLEPYIIQLNLQVSKEYGSNQTYAASTEFYYLPAKNSGSTVKIDNLYGGMLVANNATQYAFRPLLPFGFYASCDGYLKDSPSNVSAYKDLGFNALNPVCAYTDGDLDPLFDTLDAADLWYQYDMRNSYLNLSSVEEQIPRVKDRSNLLSWYTADEPDGWQYNLSSTKRAHDLLKKADPYHPTSLVLNCDNYYFDEYSSGADYVMQDAYPVGINTTYSRKFNTTVNSTYGDAGCDNCEGMLRDVSNRLDVYTQYLDWLGDPRKPLWSVLQAFSGDFYWEREPTPAETWVMIVLSLSHRAKGVMSWLFPSSPNLNDAHGSLAKAVTAPGVSKYLLGGQPTSVNVTNHPLLDVAYWQIGGRALVAMANLDYSRTSNPITIELPFAAKAVAGQPWGSLSWSLSDDNKLGTYGLDGLATSILILDT